MENWSRYFRYNNGRLYWLNDVLTNRGGILIPAGKEAGGLRRRPNGSYWAVGLNNKRYYRHRVIWEMFHGKIPNGYVINHINGIPGDDRVENIEAIPKEHNSHVSKSVNISSTNTSGKRGVSYDKSRGKWEAKGWEKGKTIHLGRYTTFEDACKARDIWEEKVAI